MEITEWTEETWKEKIDECFKNKTHQSDCVVAVYKMAFPNWDQITKIEGWPSVGRGISEYLFRKSMEFDRKHHPDVFAGGLWMNNGWSTEEKLGRWEIDMSTAKAKY